MLALIGVVGATVVVVTAGAKGRDDKLGKINHIVVIYEENHSFDNLYGGWEGVNGRANADAALTTQIGQGGTPYTCLLQKDVNLTSPPLPADCADTTTATPFTSHFTNAPFRIDDYLSPTDTTCPTTPSGVRTAIPLEIP